MIGQTISHYRILERLGGGGMGVVYKAQDTKLDRFVALKFLPPDMTLDPEAKERFVHEAKAASALQHNNICTVHDIDESPAGQMFIVMDCYEGETLKTRIAKGTLRIEEATDIAVQIAQGLAKAHERGIVHRDIKPANIMITKDGGTKIVDFGLAKLTSATKLTKTGSTLGTVAYMAPEQLQGGTVDARADIFSLGVVLYEMLTGKTPFRGDHEAALMYAIMNEEPEPLQTHIPDVSSELIHIVGRALEKDPASRYKTMDDLLIDLRRVTKEMSHVPGRGLGTRRMNRFSSRGGVVIASAIVLAGIVLAVVFSDRPRKLPHINPDRAESIVPLPVKDIGSFVMSPDGNWIAFEGIGASGEEDIYYMNTFGGAVRQVTFDSSSIVLPTDISRDGAWVLYTRVRHPSAPYEVVAVPSLGGSVRSIAAGWLAMFIPGTDRILFSRGGYSGVPSTSGKFELCSTKMDGSDTRVVFVDPGNSDDPNVPGISLAFAVSPKGNEIAWLKTFPDFSQDIIVHDLKTGKERQVTFSRGPKETFVWTKDDYLIYPAYAAGNYDLWMCPTEGGDELQVTRSRNDEETGMLSEDGTKLLIYERNVSGNIKSMDLATGRVTSITSDDRNRGVLCVSPDGRYVAYSAVPSYNNILTWRGIQIIDTKGEERPRTICEDERIMGKAWSPAGKWIAYTRIPDSAGGATRICIVSPTSGSQSRVVAEVKDASWRVISLRWISGDTLSWFCKMKTWMCAVDPPRPVQFYEDSTSAWQIRGGKAVLYRDFHVGRLGYWVDISPLKKKTSKKVLKKIIATNVIGIAPGGEFLLSSPKPGEVYRVSLPDGNTMRLPFSLPQTIGSLAITQDGKAIVYIDVASNSKLMLWKNPFLRE